MVSLEEKIKEMLPLVSKPARYLGNEINSVHKDHRKIELKVALAFPDTYEVGMSHLGLKILYHILNAQNNILAERVYTPWIDAQEIMKSEKIPLFSLESRTPLKDFDIIGFSLQYELTYTNILTILDLAGIPLKAKERKEVFPLIIAGGSGAYNPEPLADFMDCFVIGEGEEVILEIAQAVTAGRKRKENKDEILYRLSRISGVYIPSLYGVSYHLNGTYRSFEPKRSDIPKRIRKRIISNLDKAYYPTRFILPFLSIIHDRIALEVRRGCGRGCRFCQAGIIYRPPRERNIDSLLSLATEAIQATGYEEFSLSSLNVGDYKRLKELILSLRGRLNPYRISLSLPSSRVDTFPLPLEGELKRGSITLAPEAAREPLRKVINKAWEKEEFLENVEKISSFRRPLKLYFMLGLPGEKKEDVEAIVELAKEVKRRHPSRVSLSLAPFVPKAHTPFQWRGQEKLSQLKEKIWYLKRSAPRRVEVRAHNPEASFLEAIFSRGDRRLGKVLFNAYKKGCRFDGWREEFKFHLWQDAFTECDIDPSFYAHRRRDYGELLPWDHIDVSIGKEFLIEEDRRASRSVTQLPSYPVNQSKTNQPANRQTGKPANRQTGKPANRQTGKQTQPISKEKVRIKFTKGKEVRFISHLDMVRVFTRAIRRARLPIATTCGFVPRERISFSSPLPLGLTSESEYADIGLVSFVSPQRFKERLNRELPPGLEIKEAEIISLKSKSLMATFDCADYEVKVPPDKRQDTRSPEGQAYGADKIQKFLKRKKIFIKRETKKGHRPRGPLGRWEIKEINIRPLILKLELRDFISGNQRSIGPGSNQYKEICVLRMLLKINVRPQEVAKTLLNLSKEESLKLVIERKGLLKS